MAMRIRTGFTSDGRVFLHLSTELTDGTPTEVNMTMSPAEVDRLIRELSHARDQCEIKKERRVITLN